MKIPDSFAELASGRIIPILQDGIETGSVQLQRRDCEDLLFVLRTSIPLEPFLTLFNTLIARAVNDWKKAEKNEDSNRSDI